MYGEDVSIEALVDYYVGNQIDEEKVVSKTI